MRYLDATGRTVPAHLALSNGQLRAGFTTSASDVLGDGERVGFEMAFMVGASGAGRVAIHDNGTPAPISDAQAVADARAAYDKAREAADDNIRNAWRHRAPAVR